MVKNRKVTFHGRMFRSGGYLWKNIRTFAFDNRSIFEILFIILYAVEQGGLIYIVFMERYNIKLVVSLFAVIVLTTFAFHKLMMESRIKILENKVLEMGHYTDSLVEESSFFEERYDQIVEAYNKINKKGKSL